jgi:hypothetical protein
MIDIIRTSASRPDYLKTSTEALRKNLKYDGKLRKFIHEDRLNIEWSNECINYLNSINMFMISKVNQTPIGQGASLTWLLDQCTSPYILNVEDDYELLKPLDLTPLVELMNKHPKINQIAFHKRRISWKRGKNAEFKKKQLVIDDIPLVTNPHWAFTPALWRASYIKPKWEHFEKNIHWRMNDVLKGNEYRNADWVIDNTGTYFLGYGLCCLKEFGGDKTREEYMKLDNGYYMKHLGRHKHGEGGSVRLNDGYAPGRPYWEPPRTNDILTDFFRIT